MVEHEEGRVSVDPRASRSGRTRAHAFFYRFLPGLSGSLHTYSAVAAVLLGVVSVGGKTGGGEGPA